MSEIKELKETYSNFLNQLVKTKCLYKSENEKDNFVIKRIEALFTMIEKIETNNIEKRIMSYINFFEEFVEIVLDKKTIEITDIQFFQYFCKALEKKPNKANSIFFLNDVTKKTNINVGMIARNQSSHNFNQIKNYIYIMYIQSCNIIYPDIKNMKSSTKKIFTKILDDFSIKKTSGENDDVKDEIKKLCTSVLDEILPEEVGGGKKMFDDIFNNNEFSGVFDNVLNSISNQHGVDLKKELQNTKKEDIVNVVNSIKEDFSKLNLFEMMNNLDLNNIGESINSVKSHLQETMGGSFAEDFEKTFEKTFEQMIPSEIKPHETKQEDTTTKQEDTVIKQDETTTKQEDTVIKQEDTVIKQDDTSTKQDEKIDTTEKSTKVDEEILDEILDSVLV